MKPSFDRLAARPLSGRPGRIVGTREIALEKIPYALVYRVLENSVEIARVFNTARLFPGSLVSPG